MRRVSGNNYKMLLNYPSLIYSMDEENGNVQNDSRSNSVKYLQIILALKMTRKSPWRKKSPRKNDLIKQ